jgi:pimeloyl-ACP methyl ester carboxylesterase
MSNQAIENIVQAHERNGNYVTVDGVKTFYLDTGSGPVVFCIHGVPTSSFLYRKVGLALQQRGLRAVSIDLPGLGLSDRPENFDYTFSSFGTFCNHFLDALNIHEVHLIIHDIGTPLGLLMAAENSSRIKSITVLNSMLDLEKFVKPLPMRPFEKRVLGEAELAMLTPATFPLMMKTAGVVNNDVISHAEMGAYIHLLKRTDGGKAFLKIMRSFEQTKEFTLRCYSAFRNRAYPVQLIWGEKDPFLPFEQYGKQFEEARPGIPVTKVKSKHFLQEEEYELIAAKVKEIVVSAGYQVAT